MSLDETAGHAIGQNERGTHAWHVVNCRVVRGPYLGHVSTPGGLCGCTCGGCVIVSLHVWILGLGPKCLLREIGNLLIRYFWIGHVGKSLHEENVGAMPLDIATTFIFTPVSLSVACSYQSQSIARTKLSERTCYFVAFAQGLWFAMHSKVLLEKQSR